MKSNWYSGSGETRLYVEKINGKLIRYTWRFAKDPQLMVVQYRKGKEKPQREAEPDKQASHAQSKQAPTKTRPAPSQ